MADLHDLAAAYALDALDREEREEFERHLAGCDRCRVDVALYAESAGRLADATAVPPPPHLKKAVMDALDERETPVVASISRQRRNRTFSIGIAAALVASSPPRPCFSRMVGSPNKTCSLLRTR